MHETGLRKRGGRFLGEVCKSFILSVLQRATESDEFFNSRLPRPRWANSHSGLGEMTQVTCGENPLPSNGPKSENDGRNSILDIPAPT